MNDIQSRKANAAIRQPLANVDFTSCQGITALIDKTRDAILNEIRETLNANDHLLHLALNEAEALAWQTEFPHLVFPTLAAEKAQALVAWSARQKAIQQANVRFALAA